MNDLADLLAGFDVSVIGPIIKMIADAVAKFLSPVLLIVAIFIRLMETQVDALVSGGKYGTAIRDILMWTFVLGTYFAICTLVIDFFNPIFAWLDQYGSLKTVMKVFADFSDKNDALHATQGQSLTTVLSTPYYVVSVLFYYGTLIMLAFLTAFLKVANVMAFGVGFIWGLIAIPISISTTFKILRGWGFLVGFTLVWPIIQGLMLWMFSLLFSNSMNSLTAIPDSNSTLQAANVMMLFATMHLLMCAVMVAAPFIANSLVTNTPAGAGIVMPFVGAAIAAGAGMAKGLENRGGGGFKMPQMPSGGSASKMNQGPTPRLSSQAGARFNPPAASVNSASGGGVANKLNADAAGSDVPTPPASVSATPDTSQQKAQRRRGVIIRQQKKPG